MDTSPYNDYVLSSSREAGWISDEQEQQIRTAVEYNPGTAALELMEEQGLLAPENAQTLRDLIYQAMGANGAEQHQEPPAEAPAQAPQHRTFEIGDTIEFKVMDDYLLYGLQFGASDIHIGPDSPPLMRHNGLLQPLYHGAQILTAEETERLARSFLDEKHLGDVVGYGAADYCYEIPGKSRFRTSVVRQRRGWESVFRIINSRVRTMQELGLPKTMYDLIKFHNGLILVTGAVGSGKSTTLASMVYQISQERKDHIITLEDPIEYVFPEAQCQISQREIGVNSKTFGSALRAALREDPDVIMVGEMRDLETTSLAITASETGHLVLGTLHTSSAPRTLDRLLDVFPIEQQAQIRQMVSESIRGIICQQLVPRADGRGRVLALEIMTNSAAVANLIREKKTFMLHGVMQTGKKQGMKLMDDSLMELLEQRIITPQEAYNRSDNKKIFAPFLKA